MKETMTRILHREIDSCMGCPFMVIVGDTENTIIACKNREVMPEVLGFNAREIIKQPMHYVVADVGIPDWCPLPQKGE